MVSPEQLAELPKVALHDHLDGGLRPATIIDLAGAAGLALPATEPAGLGDWFYRQANSGSLERYLTTFDITIAVMQTRDNLRRVAREWVLDLAGDGVVYAEARWAPAQHTRAGLSLEDGVRAVRDGLAEGAAVAAGTGQPIVVRQLLCQLRGQPAEPALVDLAVAYRDDSVAGLDCAGPEAGFDNADFAALFEAARRANLFVTIHAGEAAGLRSIEQALVDCGAHRLGHGVHLIDDIDLTGPVPRLGPLANYVASLGIPVEVCPSSNLQTGLAPDIAHHPFEHLRQAGVNLTINCDNRLMSATTMSREFGLLAEAFGYDIKQLGRFCRQGARAGFLPFAAKRALVDQVDRRLVSLGVDS